MFYKRNRFKAYQQLEYSDCGITCIRMICHYYGKKVSLQFLRNMCDIGRLGISLKEIVNCLRKLHFEVAAVRVDAEEVLRMPLPAILFWEQNHFVVLYDIDHHKKCFYVADPSHGKIPLNEDTFMQMWKGKSPLGLAVVMAPNECFSKDSHDEYVTQRRLLNFIIHKLRKYWWNFSVVSLLAAIAIATDAYLPVLFQQTIDSGIAQKNVSIVWMLVGSQLLIFIGQYVSSSISHVIDTKIGLRMHVSMVTQYLQRLILKPISFFDIKINADLIQKLNDLERIKAFLLELPSMIFFTLTSLLVFSALLIYYNIGVFLLFVISTSASLLWTRIFLQRRREIDYAYTTQSSENRNQIYELIMGMTEVKTSSAQHSRVEKWQANQHELNALALKSSFTDLYISSGNAFLNRMKDFLITGICATLVVRGNMTMGAMLTVSYICGRLDTPFNNLIKMVSLVQNANMSYERLDEILNEKDSIPSNPPLNLLQGDLDVVIQHVSFKYPGSSSSYVLNDITLQIPHGTTIALVGESGCGKTSLIKLLLGFYPIAKGTILVNGLSLSQISTDAWLECCGAVLQNGYIFSGSILENIALNSADEMDIERIKEAARVACIDDFFSSLPMGYHTKIGSNGLELSGGQKQRLLIARAVYKRPQILFLDEATSSLDANNERKIVENLTSFAKGRTVIIAAHRLSTIRSAHQIAFFEKGILKELGSHSELIERKGAYYNIVRNQMSEL